MDPICIDMNLLLLRGRHENGIRQSRFCNALIRNDLIKVLTIMSKNIY